MRQKSSLSVFALWGFMFLCVQLYAGQAMKNMPLTSSLNQSEVYSDGHNQDLMKEKPSCLNKVMTRFVQKRLKKQLAKWEKEYAQIDDHCDLIIKRDGSEVSAKIIEITSGEVKYKKCGYIDGPTFSMKKSEIFMLKYGNGTKEVFENTPATPSHQEQYSSRSNNTYKARRPHGLAVAAMSLGLGGVLIALLLSGLAGAILGIGAIVLGAISLGKIRRNPEQFRGRGMAWIGIAGGALAILLVGLLLLFLLSAY